MRRCLLFGAVFFICFFEGQGQLLFKVVGDSLWAYSFSGGDEFNTRQLNENDWKNGLGGRRVLMSQDLAFSPRNVYQQDGLIHFVALKEDSLYTLWSWEVDSTILKREKMILTDNKFLTKYSVGGIVSKKKYHYGLYELRFKVEEGRGVWPAFWFWGGNKNEEIDAFELKGEKNDELHVDTHCPYGCDHGYKNSLGINTNWGGWMKLSNYLHEGFNTMYLEWRPEEVIWYINGLPLAYFKGRFPNPMNLFLNTSVAKDGGAFKPGPDATTHWPNTYSVDYLRIWSPLKINDALVLRAADSLIDSGKFAPAEAEPKKKRGLMYRKKELDKIEGTVCMTLSKQKALTIKAMGKLREKQSSITIKYGSFTQTFTALKKDIKLQIDPGSEELLLEIDIEGKRFSRKISLRS